MFKEQVKIDLLDKIPQNAKCWIFGACEVGEKIFNDIKNNREDVKIIGFVDNKVNGKFLDLPIINLKDFLNEKNYDLLIMSTRKEFNALNCIFNLYQIPVLIQSPFLYDYYRNKHQKLSIENYQKVKNIFSETKDKNLFDFIFKLKTKLIDVKKAEKYYEEKYSQKIQSCIALEHQYLENINKDKIKTVFDIGFNSGINALPFNKILPNLQKLYGFEVIYDYARIEYLENIITNNKLQLVHKGFGDQEATVDFYVNKAHTGRSFCAFSREETPKDIQNWDKIQVDITTIDKFCEENNVYPDFIKMDIEGAEPSALKGGIKTIQKYRPQLAISIYHSDSDFIDIPLYLYENLENYTFHIEHYSPRYSETVLYAIPNELK